MKFDYAIGNPPYQDTGIGDNTKAPSVYNYFLESGFKVATVVEMIHPARFLFDAGDTDKKWNRKMLSDPHYKVLYYRPLSASIFPNTDIKGGVAVTYRDKRKDFGPIEHFLRNPNSTALQKRYFMRKILLLLAQ